MKFAIGQVLINWSDKGLNFKFPIADREISLTINVTPEKNPEVKIELNIFNAEKED